MRKYQIAAVMALTFLVFAPAIRYGFVYDDGNLIVENPRLAAWSNVPGYFTAHLFAGIPLKPVKYFRPLHLLWYRLLYATTGAPNHLWHLASILAHLAAVFCVFLLLRQLIGDSGRAALAASLFAIHPIQTEAVAWVSCACDPLLAIFVVLSLYFYIRRKGAISELSLLLALLAMLTKEPGIMVPALIFAYEWSRSRAKNALAAAAPYLLPAVLYLALRANALGRLANPGSAGMSVWEMILRWPHALAIYALHLVWPIHFSPSYDVPVRPAAWPMLLLLLAAAGSVWILRRSSANLKFGAAWIAITLAPALAIRYVFPNDYIHDRYLYLPMVGVAIVVAECLTRVRVTLPRAATAGVAVLLLSWQTHANLPIWQNNISLFRRAVEVAPRNPYDKINLAAAYLKEDRAAEALPLLKQALELAPTSRTAYVDLGYCYQALGQDDAANYYFSRADTVAGN